VEIKVPRYIAENDVYNLFNARGVAQLHVGDIDVLPRADVVEVVHGRWEKQLCIDHCSVCHKVRPYDVQADMVVYWTCNYCPNCGAKMDLED
jgi:hypothetical protein